ncbi:serine/threonine protein kinase [Vibrio maritimus]|uniref:serine/threonine protein kinase n=1 Tax=Vibrio maritimus TaxID=990268 RepID=UPI0040691360
MSDNQGSNQGFIDQLVVKAIEKRKMTAKQTSSRNKLKLEYVLFSQFDVLDTLVSKNGRATIYHLAKKDEPEKQLCCKVINEDAPDFANNMLIDEASRLELSQHPSVANFIKIGTEFERPYLMYEWVVGETIADKMQRHSNKGFRHDHIAWLVYQLAGALEFMHTRGVCHLDIKPANVLVSEGDYIKLIDFGASRYIGEAEPYAEASLNYASPYFIESGIAEPQDDVYSLALLTGHLFLGSIFGDSWHKQLKSRKRPSLIPSHVWKLIKEVVNKPRGHGFTAISFAQQLARINTSAIDSQSSAPIFSNLRNADLVLTHCRPQERAGLKRFKVLELTLAICVAVTSGFYIYQQSQPKWQSIVAADVAPADMVSSIKPAQTASFLSLPPWDIEFALNDMEKDVVSTAPYREAYEVQQLKLADLYQENQSNVAAYQGLADELPTSVLEVRNELIELRQKLVSDGALFPYADKTLTSAMAALNRAAADSYKLSTVTGSKAQHLAQLILSGESKQADQELKEVWLLNQSKAYFYSQVLPKRVMEQIDESIAENTKAHYYSKAISKAEAATQFFGQTPELAQKIRDLKVARSEFILFSTVTEKSIFGKKKLHDSLAELEQNAPGKFSEITDLLGNMATDSIDKSHQKSMPARGAIAVERALKDYLTESRG